MVDVMSPAMNQYEFSKLNVHEPGQQSFVWPEEKRPNIPHDHFDCELPIVDLAPVLQLESLQMKLNQLEGDAETRAGLEKEIKVCEEAKLDITSAIRAACEEYGFFQLVNSGISLDLVEQAREIFKQLFDLPFEDKMKIVESPVPGKPACSVFGYAQMKRQNALVKKNGAFTWSEGLRIEVPERLYPGRTEEILNTVWPGENENSTKRQTFRSIVKEYGEHCSKLTFTLLDLMAASLGIPQEEVDKIVNDREKKPCNGRMRVNNYPICEHPELTWGLPVHTDPDLMTILHQDSVGGLQIRFKDGTWHGVKPKPDAFLISCGDFVQAWTNGRFVSAEHRVVVNEKTRRMTIAYFADANAHCVVSPQPACVDAEHPARYRPFTLEDFILRAHPEASGLGSKRGEVLDSTFGIQT